MSSNSILVFIFLLSTPALHQSVPLPNILRNDSGAIQTASNDYGNIVHETPRAVLDPSSAKDIAQLIKSSYLDSASFTVSARGNGHSVRGQAMARNGVVVDMSSLREKGRGRRRSRIRVFASGSELGFYADVGGEQLWIDVLREALKKGLSPVMLPDYLHLTVGGTLSNAGIGGQTFSQGPLISNVFELDVITGKGESITCSKTKNRELFYGVLGGLGQFGIITRARIVLRPAPTRVKWVQVLYKDFSKFTRDQEFLISSGSPNYVEGFIIPKSTSDPNTASTASFSCSSLYRCDYSFTRSTQSSAGLSYIIELVKYYDNHTASTIDKEFKALLKELNFIPGFILNKDVPIFDFLNRVGDLDNPKPPPEAHPWLNLFIPKSRILDFNSRILANIIPRFNVTNGLYIFYPLNKNKWDDLMSAITPDEDVFYTLGLLHTCKPNETAIFDELNGEILELCSKYGIKVKQYLPHFKSKTDWMNHFVFKWDKFQARKRMFDPKLILSPGQGIFNT